MRLRAGWRLLIQTILMIVLFIITGIFLAFFIQIFFGGKINSQINLFLSQVIEFIVFLTSIYITRRFVDKRSFISLGLVPGRQAIIDLLAGIGITFLMMGMIYLIMLSAGWLEFEKFAWEVESVSSVLVSTLSFLIVFVFVGWNEELLSRGYHLQTLASGLNLVGGIVLSSAVFGLLHLGNPNATWISAAGIFLAGLFLAYGYVRTRQLWLSIGLHIGWNFFEGVVFGFPVSGLDIYPLTHIRIQGPELWTGGAFGPEAGLVVIPGLLLGSILINYYSRLTRKNQNI
ncbi:MAG: hypothetical protein A2Y54_01250 [Chloroflexi bacterium RBG_16_51_16]|nr:MAG: hypothetical protein A2Y54_01250 [Chloroflexi bacterium RBG_16_51_16]